MSSALPTAKFFDMPPPSLASTSRRGSSSRPTSPRTRSTPVLPDTIRRSRLAGGQAHLQRRKLPVLPRVGPAARVRDLFTVDNRGTGLAGARRFWATRVRQRHMGTVDADDQIWAARTLAAENPWVDANHMGIWGWSNGGYLSAKGRRARVRHHQLRGAATAPTSGLPPAYDKRVRRALHGPAAGQRARVRPRGDPQRDGLQEASPAAC